MPYPWAFRGDQRVANRLTKHQTISFDHWVIIVSIFLQVPTFFWTLVGLPLGLVCNRYNAPNAQLTIKSQEFRQRQGVKIRRISPLALTTSAL